MRQPTVYSCALIPDPPRPSDPTRTQAARVRATTLNDSTRPRTRYAFLTLTDYSMIALTNAIEPLRMANRVSGQAAYEWMVVTLDGQPATASNGLMITPTTSLADALHADIVFVCGGTNVREAVTP